MAGETSERKAARPRRGRWLALFGGGALLVAGAVVALLLSERPTRPLPRVEMPAKEVGRPSGGRAKHGDGSVDSEHHYERVTTRRSSAGGRTTVTTTKMSSRKTVHREVTRTRSR